MEGIKIRIIIEVLGTPKEHLEKTMILLSESIEKKYEVLIKNIHEPVKHSEKFFSSFIELELIVENMSEIIGLVIDYQPSSIEVVEPETITDSAQNLTFVINDLISKIHKFDMQTKILLAKNKLLEDKGKETK